MTHFSTIITLVIIIAFSLIWSDYLISKYRSLKAFHKEICWLDVNIAAAELIAGFNPRERVYCEPTAELYELLTHFEGVADYAKTVTEFIGYSGVKLEIKFVPDNSILSPAQIMGSVIEIQKKYHNKKHALGAILAHEITHAFITHTRHVFQKGADSELLTDYIAIALGLGKLILKGRKVAVLGTINQPFMGQTTLYEMSHFGYFSHPALLYAMEKDRQFRKISLMQMTKNLNILDIFFVSFFAIIVKLRNVSKN